MTTLTISGFMSPVKIEREVQWTPDNSARIIEKLKAGKLSENQIREALNSLIPLAIQNKSEAERAMEAFREIMKRNKEVKNTIENYFLERFFKLEPDKAFDFSQMHDLEIWTILNWEARQKHSGDFLSEIAQRDAPRLQQVLDRYDDVSRKNLQQLKMCVNRFEQNLLEKLLKGNSQDKYEFRESVRYYGYILEDVENSDKSFPKDVLAEFNRRIEGTFYAKRLICIKEAYEGGLLDNKPNESNKENSTIKKENMNNKQDKKGGIFELFRKKLKRNIIQETSIPSFNNENRSNKSKNISENNKKLEENNNINQNNDIRKQRDSNNRSYNNNRDLGSEGLEGNSQAPIHPNELSRGVQPRQREYSESEGNRTGYLGF